MHHGLNSGRPWDTGNCTGYTKHRLRCISPGQKQGEYQRRGWFGTMSPFCSMMISTDFNNRNSGSKNHTVMNEKQFDNGRSFINTVCVVKPHAIRKTLLLVCLCTITPCPRSTKGRWEATDLDVSPVLLKQMGPDIANCSLMVPFPCLVCFLKSKLILCYISD